MSMARHFCRFVLLASLTEMKTVPPGRAGVRRAADAFVEGFGEGGADGP